MRCVSRIPVIPLPKPNTFAGLMELYESNYIKIRRLCNNIKVLSDYSVSKIDHGMDLHCTVMERTKYTVTINLSYHFSASRGITDLKHYPNVMVRIYFDAMQAEVLQRVSKPRQSSSCSNFATNSGGLCNKWADNRFLFKWLSFCLHQGHQFGLNNSQS